MCAFACGGFRCASFRKWRCDTGVKLIFLKWLWLCIMKLDTETIVSYTHTFKVDDVELGEYDEIVADLLGIKIFWPFHLGNKILSTVDFHFICLFACVHCLMWKTAATAIAAVVVVEGQRKSKCANIWSIIPYFALLSSYNINKFMWSSLYSLRRYRFRLSVFFCSK